MDKCHTHAGHAERYIANLSRNGKKHDHFMKSNESANSVGAMVQALRCKRLVRTCEFPRGRSSDQIVDRVPLIYAKSLHVMSLMMNSPADSSPGLGPGLPFPACHCLSLFHAHDLLASWWVEVGAARSNIG